MDTALYYTFSTISQTLAGAIALLGAFVLYRLQIHRERLKEIGERVTWYCGMVLEGDLKTYLKLEQYDKFLERCEKRLPGDEKDPEQFYIEFEKFKNEKGLKVRLFPNLKMILGLTIGVIIYSVLILVLTPFISSCRSLSYIIMGIGIIGILGCLWLYYRLIMLTLL